MVIELNWKERCFIRKKLKEQRCCSTGWVKEHSGIPGWLALRCFIRQEARKVPSIYNISTSECLVKLPYPGVPLTQGNNYLRQSPPFSIDQITKQMQKLHGEARRYLQDWSDSGGFVAREDPYFQSPNSLSSKRKRNSCSWNDSRRNLREFNISACFLPLKVFLMNTVWKHSNLNGLNGLNPKKMSS